MSGMARRPGDVPISTTVVIHTRFTRVIRVINRAVTAFLVLGLRLMIFNVTPLMARFDD